MVDAQFPPDDDQEPDFLPEFEGEQEEKTTLAPFSFDINDPDMFEADHSFTPDDFSIEAEEERNELAQIIDEATLEKVVTSWFAKKTLKATPIVDGLLFRGSIAAFYGASHAGKTIYTLMMMFHVAAGIPFGDLAVRKSPVVYLNAENAGALNKMIESIVEFMGTPEPDNFKVMHSAFDVRSRELREKLIQVLPKLFGDDHLPPVFVFDTLAQHLSGVDGEAIDENSAPEMGKYIYGLRVLAERTNGTVLLIGHTGKDAEKGMRGSSAIRAALDTELELKGIIDAEHGRMVRANVTKQKMCQAMESADYKLEPVVLKKSDDPKDDNLREDDVLIRPERDESQYTRKVAPSNQGVVVNPEPHEPNDDDEPAPKRKEKSEPAKSVSSLSEQQVEETQIITDHLIRLFKGNAKRQDLVETWRDCGMKPIKFNVALRNAIRAGKVIDNEDGTFSSSVKPSSVGKIGSPLGNKE